MFSAYALIIVLFLTRKVRNNDVLPCSQNKNLDPRGRSQKGESSAAFYFDLAVQLRVGLCLFGILLRYDVPICVTVQKAHVHRTLEQLARSTSTRAGLRFFDDECTRGSQVRRDVTRYFGTILGTFFSSYCPLPDIAEKNG